MTAAAPAMELPGGEIVVTRRPSALRQLLRKRIATAAMVFLLFFYLVGIFAPLVAPYDPNKQEVSVSARTQGPSAEHWFGTDRLGRDLLSRVIYATRITVLFTIVVFITGGIFLGLGLGLLAGYRGGWVDNTIMRIGEVLSSLPTLVLIIAISAAFRGRITQFSYDLADNTWLSVEEARTFVRFSIIALATLPFAWYGSARIVRSQALYIRESQFVEAAELMGASTWRVLTRHILPGVLPLFLVGVSGSMAGIAGAEVGLSYLGLGIEAPTASYGSLILAGGGPKTFAEFPHLLLAPAIPVALYFFAWNLLGDALVDIVIPRLRER